MRPNKLFAVACALALATIAQPFARAAAPAECFVYIGTYTGAKSKGVYLYRMDMATGNLTPQGLVAEAPNPTFLDIDPSGKILYAADEINNYEGKRAGKV